MAGIGSDSFDPPKGGTVPTWWFVSAVVVSVAIATISAGWILTHLPPKTASQSPLPGTMKVLVDTQGSQINGEYSVRLNVTGPPEGAGSPRLVAIVLLNVTCESPSAPSGMYCTYFLFECPCDVQYVNYTWLELPIVGTYVINSTTLSPGDYEFGVGVWSGHSPAAVFGVEATVSVELVEFE